MFFHISAFTVGMTKNGEISSTRTMPRPANGSLMSSAIAMPNTTVMRITLPSSKMVLTTAVPNEGSVTKYSKFSSPAKPVWSGCMRL
ncbi:hypothetical protein D3C72_2001260 [compost metagenome]